MSKIDELIEKRCPNGVEYKKLGEIAVIGTGSSNTQDQVKEGKYPFYVRSPQIKRASTYEFDETAIVTAGDGDVGKVFHFVEGKYALHQRAYRIHVITSNLQPKYCYWYMVSKFRKYVEAKACSATVKSLRKPMFQEFPVPIPPMEIQEEIVRILDSFSELVAKLVTELETELEAREEQYRYYLSSLLSRDAQALCHSDAVHYEKLGSLFDFKNGLNKGKEHFGHGTPIVNYTDVYSHNSLRLDDLHGRVDASNAERQRFDVKRGDVFFTRTSETREEIGIASVALEDIPDGVFSGFVLRGRPKTNRLLPEYCAYCFSDFNTRAQIIRYSTLTTRALTNGRSLSKVVIPVPPLEEQYRIVSILDKFDALVNDLSSSIPAEIEARRKQYEYYRDKLLTFKEKPGD